MRYPHARSSSSSSNRFVEIGRLLFNAFRGIFQLINLLNYSIATLNNILSSLPVFIQNIVHIILGIFFPFYSICQGYMRFMNRIHRIICPFYRVLTLITRLFAFLITLPIRILTFFLTQTQVILQNLFTILIIAAIVIGLIIIFTDEHQLNYIKSYIWNSTNMLIKQCSMI